MKKYISVILLLALLGMFALYSYQFPQFASDNYQGHSRSIADYYVENTVSQTGSWNVVGAVVWMYRGYDTIGEITVLFTAALSVSFLWRMKEE